VVLPIDREMRCRRVFNNRLSLWLSQGSLKNRRFCYIYRAEPEEIKLAETHELGQTGEQERNF